VVCIGGCDAERCYQDVFVLKWAASGQVKIESLPALPRPLAFMAAVGANDVIYVAGGQEATDRVTATRHFWALDLSQRDDSKTDAKTNTLAWRELES